MNNSETIAYIEEFLNKGHQGLNKKSQRYNKLGDIALYSAAVIPILLLIALLGFSSISILRIVILSIAIIPFIIFIAFVTYFFSGIVPLALKDEVVTESLKYYKGVQNLRPLLIKTLNCEILNKKYEKYMRATNLSKSEKEVFDQLYLENYQGTIEQLITISKKINK
jgi:DNA-directed RNA polymerase subunit N (RpoN/RPB10)